MAVIGMTAKARGVKLGDPNGAPALQDKQMATRKLSVQSSSRLSPAPITPV
jgi:hypothetical protein